MTNSNFTTKKTSLFDNMASVKNSDKSVTSAFVNAGLKKSAETLSGNGALKYSTSGDPFVDQFNMLGTYRTPRPFNEIEKDCEILWAENKLMCVKFIYFIRMISRIAQYPDGRKTAIAQKGGELKHEGIMRMIWLQMKDPKIYWNTVGLVPTVGSWHDIFAMLQYDLVYNGWENRCLDWNKYASLILSALNNENTVNLVKKYLPQIKAKSVCKTVEAQADTIIAKWIASYVFGKKDPKIHATYKLYRQMKSSGTAHEWQQLISKQQYEKIDFEKIHGRALHLLARTKFFDNHNLREKFTAWITSDETVNVKTTEFVHELFEEFPNIGFNYYDNTRKYNKLSDVPKDIQALTNKKFNTLVNKVKDSNTYSKLIVVRDTSSSMTSTAQGTKSSSFDIGKALALYFSEFLTGPFANAYMEFNTRCEMRTWKGRTPIEKWFNDATEAYGSTNFLSVIYKFIEIKESGVKESDFPTGILCISDGEFNPADLNTTNVSKAKELLYQAGFSKEYIDNFVIVLWDIPNNYYGYNNKPKFETFGNIPNVFYMSGYSASIVSFLSDRIATPKELFEAAMNQETLNIFDEIIK